MIREIGAMIVRLTSRLLALSGTERTCYACKTRIGRFLPFRNGMKDMPPSLIALDLIGSDVDNFYCPRCGSHDRERHLLMYFDAKNVWGTIEQGDILHFAPERHLSKQILLRNPRTYVKADLFPASDDVEKHDVTAMGFPDQSFSTVIANHVLEHVEADRAALSEIFRVLAPGGLAVLQTPYSHALQSDFHDPLISTDEARREAYGQEDHVRIYGQELFRKIADAGFISLLCSHELVLSSVCAKRYGVNPREPFMCFQRPRMSG